MQGDTDITEFTSWEHGLHPPAARLSQGYPPGACPMPLCVPEFGTEQLPRQRCC